MCGIVGYIGPRQAAGLLGGAIITEQIFSWPGLGSLGLTAVGQRDYPVVMSFVLLGGIAGAVIFVIAIRPGPIITCSTGRHYR